MIRRILVLVLALALVPLACPADQGTALSNVGLVLPLTASDADQAIGLDVSMHGEEAYVHTGDLGAPAALSEEGPLVGAMKPAIAD